jgi:tricorn protease
MPSLESISNNKGWLPMYYRILAMAILLLAFQSARAEEGQRVLLRKPTLSRTHVVFAFGNNLWVVPRQGGSARPLTSGKGIQTDPIFSPDGNWVAFTGLHEGNADVYVVPAGGGQPRRLTFHPAVDQAVGWTPDSKRILFRSMRNSFTHVPRLFTVAIEGGFPAEIPVPTAYEGTFSPDGSQLAYVPLPPAFTIWKRYRGGRASSVLVARLKDSNVQSVPRTDSNDFNPMWIGDRIYFLSDRNGPVTLFSYDPAGHEVNQVLPNEGLDVKAASAGPDAIVYEQFGKLNLFDVKTGQAQPLDVTVAADLETIRPHFVPAGKFILNADLSPSGARAVFETRGEIVTVPAEKGTARNLTNTSGVAERDPAWSPNGTSVAFFSDESGEYQLHVRDQKGLEPVKKYALGQAPSFYYSPVWSPDGKRIAYTDKRLKIWYLDLGAGKNTLVDTDRFADRVIDASWSPDSRWIVYTKCLPNFLRAVFLFDLQTGKRHQVTDGMSDARFPAFDRSGKYLYFAASTDVGAAGSWNMSSINRPITRSVYVVVLADNLPSPLAPESDEEKASEAAVDKDKKTAAPSVRIDFDDIDQRTLALPIEAANYTGLLAGKSGTLFLLERPQGSAEPEGLMGGSPPQTLHVFDLAKRKVEKLLEGISDVHISHSGEKLLYKQGDKWFIVGAEHPKPGDGQLKLADVMIRVDPRQEWKQMYHETWRIERDYLYDPGFHGLDLQMAEKKYAPYLSGLSSRQDLTYLFGEMLGELTLGHVYVIGGGDIPDAKPVKGGLLGADYAVENGRYRFVRIYRGENWHPELRAPLTQPGARVKAGEYLLAVNGRELNGTDNIYQAFEATADKSVLLKVGPTPDGKGAREVTVVPTDSEANLRHLAWIEDNRRKVDQLSGGRVAYVYVPDTANAGFTSFVRYFFAQAGKDAAVIDERFNRGGIIADYIVDTLRRPLIGYVSAREGDDAALPIGAIFGPKAMIINEMAGSGGDELPHYFRQAKVGPLVGKRTWGGLVGIDDYPRLIDGGIVTAPSSAFWFPPGKWEVENHGVPPDVEVELDPEALRAGHDLQLEKAVALVLEELKKNPPVKAKRPAYPNYHKAPSTAQKETPKGSGGR